MPLPTHSLHNPQFLGQDVCQVFVIVRSVADHGSPEAGWGVVVNTTPQPLYFQV